MVDDVSIGNDNRYDDDILDALLKDPTVSVMEIAKKLKTYRQKVWRKKKKLEEEKVIWGYTAVLDETKLNHVIYIILFKTKPINQDLVNLLIGRITREEPRRQGVHLINLCYVNGEYDWLLKFSASDHAMARRYYDSIRLFYDEFLFEKPVMIDVNFCMVREGKNNPDMKKLYEFIPP